MSAATEMRSIPFALTAVAALAAPLAAAPPSMGDFRLPPEAAQQAPPPDRQGPIAPDVPESRRAAPTPAPAPAPRASPPAPPGTVPPIVVPPPIAASPPPAEIRAAPSRGQPRLPPSPVAPPPRASATPAVGAAAAPSPVRSTPPTSMAPRADTAEEGGGGTLWPWALAGLLGLATLGFAAWAWMRRRVGQGLAAVPQIERPRVAPPAAPQTPPAAARTAPSPDPVPPADEPLQIRLEPLRLSLTLMNAALAWRLELGNRGPRPLIGLTIGADMIAAHASISRQEQLSGPGDSAGPATMPTRRIERLEPGETRTVEGEFRLPLGQIVPIRQGNAALLLPLARFRVEAEGARPLIRTFAVGQPGNGSALQPFRLDQGPRIYPRLAQRAFA